MQVFVKREGAKQFYYQLVLFKSLKPTGGASEEAPHLLKK